MREKKNEKLYAELVKLNRSGVIEKERERKSTRGNKINYPTLPLPLMRFINM